MNESAQTLNDYTSGANVNNIVEYMILNVEILFIKCDIIIVEVCYALLPIIVCMH